MCMCLQLPPSALFDLIMEVKVKEVSAGEEIVAEGDPSDAFYIIERGTNNQFMWTYVLTEIYIDL